MSYVMDLKTIIVMEPKQGLILSPRTFNRSIYDIFDRASKSYKKWIEQTIRIYSSNNEAFDSLMAVKFLHPYVEEFNELWSLIKSDSISLSLAKELDGMFFKMTHMTHLRSEYGYPKIGQILENGMIVLDHGLLTMCLCYSDPLIIDKTLNLRENSRNHKMRNKKKIDNIR
jgi:hypothetical protein